MFRGKEIRAKPGQRLRTALLLGGESPHNGGANAINCRGLGTCGTCAVEIVPSGAVTPRDWTDAERIRLNFPPHGPPGNAKLRLSCQVRLGGDCEVVKRDKFWGQGDDVLGPMYPEHDLEGAEHRLRTFLVYRFGGPQIYLKERGHPRLRMRHMPFVVDERARDRWMSLMMAAVDEVGVAPEHRDYLETFLGDIATFLRNR